ncbi:Helix-turn-helix domain-containing protein [Sinosporangium album]|uniref:Helix-turn-helix domain-containing protein n=2 Tax=Sinosporangium album TaxID=504805 RepID=A0A1G7Z489_9ACTN|nr:helix-turn-helix transcriptional regulator [Sinosporangium album]SDH02970.1 Helix-turn-helix domain-containing protein [Sinosporangium album]
MPEGRAVDYRQAGPTVLRMLVGAQLRRLREARKMTREEAGDTIRASTSKISRLELGRTGFKLRDVDDLLTLYGVDDEAERATVLSLAERANAPAWWHYYGDVVPSWFEAYLGLEQAACVIRTYEVQFVPGLLQTEDYARAIIRIGRGGQATPEEVERRVDLRKRRQRLLAKPTPPKLWAVIDETALRRPVGGAAVMRAQLKHLIEIAELKNITLQLMPFSFGCHAGAAGASTILRFPEGELPDIVYLEQLTSALYLDKPADTQRYWHVMNRLGIQAIQPRKTIAHLHQILRDL